MKELLENIENVFDDETQKITTYIYNNKQFSSDVFDTVVSFDSNNLNLSKMRGRKGIYVFIIKEKILIEYSVVQKWNELDGAGIKSYKKTIWEIDDCLYVGACRNKSLYSRINEHFSKEGACTSLKLSHENREFAKKIVKGYAFLLKRELETYGDIVLPRIEKRLHQRLEPKAGRSRV